MDRRMKEYNRGRDQGLDMAYRLLRDAGETKAADLIQKEIRDRGKMPVKLAITSKEVEKGIEPIKLCMYESFMCMALMVLRDQFGFGKKAMPEIHSEMELQIRMHEGYACELG